MYSWSFFRALWLTVVTCWLLLPAVGQANGVPAVEEPIVLVLSVISQGKHSPELTSHLESQLRRAGWKVAPDSEISATDRSAREGQELTQLAQRTGSRLVLWGEVAELEGPDRRIYMLVYDALKRRSEPKTRVCSFSQVEAELVKIGSLVVQQVTRSENQTEQRAKPVALLPTPKPMERPKLPRWRRGLAAALGILAAGSLAISIALTVTDGKAPGSGRNACSYLRSDHDGVTSCTRFNMPIYAAGYSVAGVLGAGMITTLLVW